MNPTDSLNYRQVREAYLDMMTEQIELATSSTKCEAELIWDILALFRNYHPCPATLPFYG